MDETQSGLAANAAGDVRADASWDAGAAQELTETQSKEFEEKLGGRERPDETDNALPAGDPAEWEPAETGEKTGAAREPETGSPDGHGRPDTAGARPIQAEGSAEGDFIERMARSAGMTKEAYMQNAERMADRQKVTGRVENLLSQGVERGLAMHIAGTELENAKLRLGLAAGSEKRMETAFLQSAARLEQRWPEVRGLGELPGEVAEALAQGLTPMEAYQQYRLAGMEKELRQLRQDAKNREGSTGSVRGGAVNVEDDFVRALMKSY